MQAHGTPIAQVDERKQSDTFIYGLVRLLGSPFSFDLLGYENIHTLNPALFITNHLGAIGPIQAILSLPVRLHPWVVSEMTDFERSPRYLLDDFVQPVLHLGGKFGLLFSTLLTKVAVRLLRGIGSIPIDRFGGMTAEGFRHSLRLLQEGKNLLIFPENSQLPMDPETQLHPFMPGFATLCSLFQAGQERMLPVYPLAVHAGAETVSIGKAEFFRPHGAHKAAINDFTHHVEQQVRQLYLELNHSLDEPFS